jgi:uncharacterized DUF497 family protein
MEINFEWDETKAFANLRKHHVGFDLAARVFLDPLAISYQDRIENGEQRWQTLGMVDGYLLLLVAHTVNVAEGEDLIRIISARKADKKERTYYEENR